MSNIQVESDLKEILNKLDGKLDNLQKDVTDVNLRLTKVETKIDEGVTPKLDSMNEEIKEIKMTQKTLTSDVADLKGAKSLIIPVVVAVTTSILTLVIRSIPIS